MKYLPHIAAGILGLLFLMASIVYLLKLGPIPEFPEGSPVAMFMGALVPTGYMAFVKVAELMGGILVMIPKSRNIGLLVLGPIIINIIAFHAFITKGSGLFDPMLIVIVVTALYLLWDARKKFAALI